MGDTMLGCLELIAYFDDAIAAPDDADARCLFAASCQGTADSCARGTVFYPAVGCIDDSPCAANDDARMSACLAGDLQCCTEVADDQMSAAGERELAQDTPGARGLQMQAWMAYAPACARGDSFACMQAGAMADENGQPGLALAQQARACSLGHVQGCRRVARLGEREPDPDAWADAARCATEASPYCNARHDLPEVRTRMAECGTVVGELPSGARMAYLGREFTTAAPQSSDSGSFARFVVPADISAAEQRSLALVEDRFQQAIDDELLQVFLALGGGRDEFARLDRSAKSAIVHARVADVTNPIAMLAYRQRLADERAGFSPAPRLTDLSAPERYLRFGLGLGMLLERLVAEELGPDRARELHRLHGGQWPGASSSIEIAGVCPDSGG